jgi:hypothetical protein
MTAFDHVRHLAGTIGPRGSTTVNEREAADYAAGALRQTEVWAVLTGCEEVGCYGADAFARSHRKELGGAAWLTLDNIGGRDGSPSYLSQERFLLTTPSDPGLVELADEVAQRRPELGARVHHGFAGAYTEGAIGGRHGFRVLTLLALTPQGRLPDWHRPTDTVDRADPAVVESCEAFTWELLQGLDRES